MLTTISDKWFDILDLLILMHYTLVKSWLLCRFYEQNYLYTVYYKLLSFQIYHIKRYAKLCQK